LPQVPGATPDVERKLAAILSADVVGYSRLMAQDEATTIRTLTDYRESIAMLVRQHRGRVVDAPGDNVLAEFPTALDAVSCAIEVQGVLRVRNASLPADRRMEFRIGIHLGDVATEGGRIYGDGVNIAARLEALADAGGISVSGTVCEQVESKLSVDLEDLSEQALKNIARPVRVYRVKLPHADGEPAANDPPASVPEELTVPGFALPPIAVLPFDNMSGDVEQEYFADGIAEDLITHLSMARTYPVIARNSSFVYKGKAVDMKQVSRELGVRYVVEGSVRKAGNRIRVTAQLIDATDGHHVWAERYDRELQDIFELQDEITDAIMQALNPELVRAESERAARRRPEDLGTYDGFMRGVWHFNKFTKEDNAEARRLFEKTIELDPHLSSTYNSLAIAHYFDVLNQWTDSPAESVGEVVRCAEKGVALDEGNPVAHMALGAACSLTQQQERMIDAFERALELNPSLALAHAWLGAYLALAGRPDDAIAHLDKAVRLSPKDPFNWIAFYGMGMAHFAAKRYEDAADWARRSVLRRTDLALGFRCLTASYAHLGRDEEARAALQEVMRLQPGYTVAHSRLTLSSADPKFADRFIGGLRRAGLKE
jgi:adenylate cyclase